MRRNYCSLFPRGPISSRGYLYVFQLRSQLENHCPGLGSQGPEPHGGKRDLGTRSVLSPSPWLTHSVPAGRLQMAGGQAVLTEEGHV